MDCIIKKRKFMKKEGLKSFLFILVVVSNKQFISHFSKYIFQYLKTDDMRY